MPESEDTTFRTTGFDKTETGRSGDASHADPEVIAEYQRGMQWLSREIHGMEVFARAWSGKNVKIKLGQFPCTDGDTIYLAPGRVKEGEEPTALYMHQLLHELAHVVVSDVFEPPSSRKIEDAIKVRLNKLAGQPAGHAWNAIEDGRAERALYVEAPGARKHISQRVGELVVEAMANPEASIHTNDDIGLLLGAYLKSAGYDDLAAKFSERVTTALADTSISETIKVGLKQKKSWKVGTEATVPFMKRAKEMGFFADWDDRALSGTTGEPMVIDWNDLTDEEKDALRRRAKEKIEGKGAAVLIKNAPEDLFEDAADAGGDGEPGDKVEPGPGGSAGGMDEPGPAPDGPDDADSPGLDGEAGSGASSSDDGEAAGSPDDADTDGDTPGAVDDEERDAEGPMGEPVGEPEPDTPEPEASSELVPGETPEVAGEPFGGDHGAAPEMTVDLTEDEITAEAAEVEAEAKKLHIDEELARIARTKQFETDFAEVEDKIRPPHMEYKDKEEAARELGSTETSRAIEEAMKTEVGQVRGGHGGSKNRFLYKMRPVVAGPSTTLAEFDAVRDLIAGEVNRLRAVFKANDKSSFFGQYEIGAHIKTSSLPGFMLGEHLKPFDRRTHPKKQSYAVTLLIDQSGSMGGQKIVTARVSLALQAEMLSKLQIPFEILGFTSSDMGGAVVEHNVFKSFNERWDSEAMLKVLSITARYQNYDGLALAWAWERLEKRREQRKILMTYSDGYPAPDTANQIAIMRYVISQMQKLGALPVGIGILSDAVSGIYPKTVICRDIRALPRQVTQVLEAELKRKR